MLSCQRRITLQLISHLDTHSLMSLQIISKASLLLLDWLNGRDRGSAASAQEGLHSRTASLLVAWLCIWGIE